MVEILGISQGSYANWEKGKRELNLSRLGDIAIYFDISIDYLTGKIDKEYGEVNIQELEQKSEEKIEKIIQDVISSMLTILKVGRLKGIPKS